MSGGTNNKQAAAGATTEQAAAVASTTKQATEVARIGTVGQGWIEQIPPSPHSDWREVCDPTVVRLRTAGSGSSDVQRRAQHKLDAAQQIRRTWLVVVG
ncbi:hypothetical protein E2562_015481 [Oryza meyeriana var. granulata]|uniref:Uncharacterized protein n=1 Tax=Oryza meyeriana var. granulata TaxID=110450 RepID=A0A6G1BWN9_9ORYZ|nr:hypothetical protein E2562_015481 [Oryza meyeriana var. granulata]